MEASERIEPEEKIKVYMKEQNSKTIFSMRSLKFLLIQNKLFKIKGRLPWYIF